MTTLSLVVEDDPIVCEIIETNLTMDGWQVITASNGAEALERLAEYTPNIVVLDILLPDMSGLEFCRLLRSSSTGPWRRMPILMLTALATQTDKLAGFSSGADDYLTKPFDPRELTARMTALIERAQRGERSSTHELILDTLKIDGNNRTVEYAGTAVILKPQEFDLLWQLAEQPGRVFTREELYKKVWKYSEAVNSRTVDMHVSHLRRKLSQVDDEGGNKIVTVFGIGYKFLP